MNALVDTLAADGSLCRAAAEPDIPIESPIMLRRRLFRLVGAGDASGPCVHVAEMAENLGYAGGINAWLRPLLQVPGWEGVWLLNPDTVPTPSALAELVAYSERRGTAMIGSCTTLMACPDHVHSRGLIWRKFVAKTLAVDFHAQSSPAPDPAFLEARLDAPSGASVYVTRGLIERIGLMDERYFLYFEDLEWGYRARRLGPIGYAHLSVVPHKGGTTIGTAGHRAAMSPLAVYLEIRNRLIFVRDKYPAWFFWTVLMQITHAAAFGAVGAFRNMMAAYQGLAAGVFGESGRPDRMLKKHTR